MIHFLPDSPAEALDLSASPESGPYAEAVARLASVRQALACVEQVAGEAASESMVEAKLAAGWPVANPARQRCYDARSARAASAAAAGLEVLASLQDRGIEPHPVAVQRLKGQLQADLDGIDRLFSL
ncbi:hypothetical protein [Sphingomonas jaspsi]|uniref:hypothetical protein n=1 Tax=Sphingomonas jaspsi TaxID=392409 RepID=UPI0004AEE06C|nr:hypothetical protein [Sphingomonas jaspsi]